MNSKFGLSASLALIGNVHLDPIKLFWGRESGGGYFFCGSVILVCFCESIDSVFTVVDVSIFGSVVSNDCRISLNDDEGWNFGSGLCKIIESGFGSNPDVFILLMIGVIGLDSDVGLALKMGVIGIDSVLYVKCSDVILSGSNVTTEGLE